MRTIKIKNFRSIKESPLITIKPLNVFIGKNSCGKSSFIRVFPLLKQSLEKPINDPILWYGDYVDFGSFDNTISQSVQNSNKSIVFSFGVNLSQSPYRIGGSRMVPVDVEFAVKDRYVEFYKFSFSNDNEIFFSNVENGKYRVYINGEEIEGISFSSGSTKNNLFHIFPDYEKEGDIDIDAFSTRELLLSYSLFMREKGNDLIDLTDLLFDVRERRLAFRTIRQRFDRTIKSFDEFEKYIIPAALKQLMDNIENTFIQEFANVQYFQPLRAQADRFYRVQGINIKNVDSDGLNAPMILYTMSEIEKKEFRKWSMDNLGFTYASKEVDTNKESTSMMIEVKGEKPRNVADVGFGYSQILPIILSIWKAIYSNEIGFSEKIIVIEQPELHLHPAFQQQVMSLILKIIKQVNKTHRLSFIIETHSESIINYLGRKIIDKEYSPNDLNLYVLDKPNGTTEFKKMDFNENGLIDNWPIGFFSFEDK